MTILNYSSLSRPKGFPRTSFITALSALAIAAALIPLSDYTPVFLPYGREPLYLACMTALLLVGEIATIRSAIALRSHELPSLQLFLVRFALLICFLGIPIALSVAVPRIRTIHITPPYRHLVSGVRSLTDRGMSPYTPPTPFPPESAWPTLAPDVDAHSAFIYTGSDLHTTTLSTGSSRIIMAYSKPSPSTPTHRVLLFADGHSQYEPDAALPSLFATSNTTRATLALFPFTLDGPPP